MIGVKTLVQMILIGQEVKVAHHHRVQGLKRIILLAPQKVGIW